MKVIVIRSNKGWFWPADKRKDGFGNKGWFWMVLARWTWIWHSLCHLWTSPRFVLANYVVKFKAFILSLQFEFLNLIYIFVTLLRFANFVNFHRIWWCWQHFGKEPQKYIRWQDSHLATNKPHATPNLTLLQPIPLLF